MPETSSLPGRGILGRRTRASKVAAGMTSPTASKAKATHSKAHVPAHFDESMQSSNWDGVGGEPCSEILFAERAIGEVEEGQILLDRGGDDLQSVEA